MNLVQDGSRWQMGGKPCAFAGNLTCRGRSRPPVSASNHTPSRTIYSHATMRDCGHPLNRMGGNWVARATQTAVMGGKPHLHEAQPRAGDAHMPDKPRFLVPKARRGDGLGYTDLPSQAMPDEPECLSVNDWKRHVETRATQTAAQRRTAEEIARDRDRRLLSQEERIVKAHTAAQASRRDVKREMWVLEQMRSQGKSPEKIETRVQHLERIVYLGRAA